VEQRYARWVLDALTITSTRLRLVLLRPEALQSLLDLDTLSAEKHQGITFPKAFLDTVNEAFLTNHLTSMTLRPAGRGWCVRAILRREDDAVIGHCGFHGPPEVIGRAEIGYTVFVEFRENGYATEAAQGLVDWAREQGSKVVFAAVSPNNPSSIRVIEKVGFRQTGVQKDGANDEEYVFEMKL
jgi:RimJ/RimL family protein N-acetyltransferase